MNRKIAKVILPVLGLLLIAAIPALAQSPNTISY